MFLSIVTPTYNRAHTLPRLYDSLLAQSDQDFEWIIVNDGSVDNTEELALNYQAQNKIAIRYFSQPNGGKQRAHNKGIAESAGELSVCVDSDDALRPDAVEKVKNLWLNCDRQHHVGVLAKRGSFTTHTPICGDWPDTLKDCTMMGLQERYGFSGDTALFFKTSLLKEHPFAEFEGEKFVPEDSLYADLDAFGTMLLCKDTLYYCEYLSDGLTANYRNLLLRNPMGTSYCYYRRMLRSEDYLNRLKNAIISKAFLIKSGKKAAYTRNGHMVVRAIAYLAAPLYHKIKKMDEGE